MPFDKETKIFPDIKALTMKSDGNLLKSDNDTAYNSGRTNYKNASSGISYGS